MSLTTREIELEQQNRELLRVQHQLAQSRLRYADLFDFAPIGYVTLDDHCDIAEINLAGARLLGGTPHQFMGRSFEQFVLPSDHRRFRQHIERCRKSSQRTHTEVQLVPREGRPTTVELYSVAGREMEQGKLQCRCAIVNISERRRAEEELRRSHAELELRANHYFLSEASAVFFASLDYDTALMNVVRMGIPRLADCCVVDIIGPSGSLSRAAVAHLDHSKEDILWELGKLPAEQNEAFGKKKVIRTARSELYANVSDSLLTAVATDSHQLELLRELGCTSYMCIPLVVRGNAMGAVGFMRVREGQPYTLADLALAEEFTDRAAVAIDNAMLYTREQEANRIKDEFLATVSHELKTPLTPILGAMYRLRSIRADDPEVQKAIDMVERNAKRQALLIDDLLDVSRLATGKFELQRSACEIDRIIHAAVEVARPAAQANGISIEISIDPGIRPIWCDANRMQQAIWNLISNAIKFSPAGSHIRLHAESTDNALQISVHDEGEGISTEFLPHVFDTFRQAGPFITRRHGGLGLGLAIVRHIIQQHGGTVRAESSGAGKGASFIIELPYPRKGVHPMAEERTNPQDVGHDIKGRQADIAARRRQARAGQLYHNVEQPAEEGAPVTSPTDRTDIQQNDEEKRAA